MNLIGNFSQMQVMQILTIQQEIHSCENIIELKQLLVKYKNASNADTFYHLGVCCMQFNEYDIAKEIFIKGAKFGLIYPNEYFDTIFSNSIGQCFYNLVNNLDFEDYKMFVLAYVYLSNCCLLTPRQAYDSLRSRAILMQNNDSFTVSFLTEYLGIGNLQEPCTISDFYYAGIGFEDNPVIQRECFNNAKNIHSRLEDISISGKDACDYSLVEIAELGEKRHKRLYDKLISDFKNNIFKTEIKP